MERARAAGERLAVRHREHPAAPQPQTSLVHYGESPRAGDWTLRSALVRLAQSQPQLVADLLERVRRLDAVLQVIARPLAQHTVLCDREITIDTVDDPPSAPYPDTRTADLVRLAASAGDDGHVVVEAYAAAAELSAEERAGLPLLEVALGFDALADELVAWAAIAPAPAPVGSVQATIDSAQQRMDELGVPVEQRPRGRGGRSR